jgi:hypothetical protein
MLPRPLLTAQVTARPAAHSLRIVSPADFRTGRWEEAKPPGGNLLPYCLDVKNRRSIYCQGNGIEKALRAPFYYVQLRQTTVSLLSVPWERGRLAEGTGQRPCFIFSIGRCGSTLLANALRNAGAPAVSEPDFLTQGMAAYLFKGPLYAGYPELSQVLRNLTDDLLDSIGSDGRTIAAIKLRAECCKAPRLIVGSDGSKSIFLIRRFPSWASSMLRVSNLSPQRLVTRYIEGLRCLQWLRQNTDCHLLTYEDLESPEADAFADAAQFLGLAPSDEMRDALSTDSQAGTPLSRRAFKERTAPAHLLEQAVRLWTARGPVDLVEELSLSDYCHMNPSLEAAV